MTVYRSERLGVNFNVSLSAVGMILLIQGIEYVAISQWHIIMEYVTCSV